MPVAPAAVAGVVALGALGFGGGYAIAAAGGDDKRAPRQASGAALPSVPGSESSPRIAVLGDAVTLPALQRKKRSGRSRDTGAAAPTPKPEAPNSSTPTPRTQPPVYRPPSSPPSKPPSKPPSNPPPDDIIEG